LQLLVVELEIHAVSLAGQRPWNPGYTKEA
jgi:hypothetical protein